MGAEKSSLEGRVKRGASLASSRSDADKDGESVRTGLIFRAVRHPTRNDRRTQHPFRPVVSRLDKRRGQRPQQVLIVVLSTQSVE